MHIRATGQPCTNRSYKMTNLVALQQWPLSLPATILAVTFFSLLFLVKLFKKRPTSNSPPSPPGLPVIGNFHQLGYLPHRSLQALSVKHGPVMLLHLGRTPTVVVSSQEIAREVMKTHDTTFASSPESSICKRLMYGSTDVAFSPYGEYWRQVRKICVIQLLSPKRVKSFQSIREEEVSLMIEKIRESVNGLVNLSEMVASLTNDVVCRAALGKKYHGAGILEGFLQLLGSFPVRDFIPWLGWIDWLSGLDGRVRRKAREIDDLLDKVFDERSHAMATTSGGVEDRNFVDVLLSLNEKNDMGGISISRDNMKAIVLDMFAAGTDTIFTSIEWAMAELVKNPQAMKRSQEEVREVVGCEGNITEESVDRMKYLKAVIKETLRLHPPGPLLVPRETIEDTELQGYDIPAGTQVIVNAWAIGRNPRYWDRPDEFDPARFMSCEIDFRGQDFQLIPFGGGRRGCPGLGFAVAMIELTLAHLLHHFDWGLPDGMKGEELDMSESPGITVHIRSSLVLVAESCLP